MRVIIEAYGILVFEYMFLSVSSVLCVHTIVHKTIKKDDICVSLWSVSVFDNPGSSLPLLDLTNNNALIVSEMYLQCYIATIAFEAVEHNMSPICQE
jgi:hypothetical protein